MNVLLISPRFPNTFWSFSHALKFIRKKSAFPPLGLVTVAAMLPAGWSLRLIDLNTGELTEEDLAWAELALVSGMVVQKQSAREVIARCRAAGLRIVAGGPLFTTEWEAFPEVDHFVLNEAELTLPPFLTAFEAGQAERLYRSADFADIRTTPIPSWDLVDLRRYASMSIQYSRGCPYQCEFCNVTALFGHRHRAKTAAQVLAELDGLYARGWRQDVFFVDDNFIGNRKRLKTELLPALIAWRRGKRVTFSTEVSINLADDKELMDLLVAAGFTTVFIGIETPDNASLAECSKKQNCNRNLIEDVRRLQRAGLQVQGGFIVGFDNDTPSIFQRQIEFIQNSGIAMAMVGLLQAPPGTRLYERLQQEGRVRGELSGDNVDGTTNIVPAMGLDILKNGYRNVLAAIYAPENYYQRVKTFLQEYQPAREGRKALSLQHRLAFFRSLYRLGIIGCERCQYWRLLLWTGLHRPKLFPLAVTLAIYGHHFRKVCELRIL